MSASEPAPAAANARAVAAGRRGGEWPRSAPERAGPRLDELRPTAGATPRQGPNRHAGLALGLACLSAAVALLLAPLRPGTRPAPSVAATEAGPSAPRAVGAGAASAAHGPLARIEAVAATTAEATAATHAPVETAWAAPGASGRPIAPAAAPALGPAFKTALSSALDPAPHPVVRTPAPPGAGTPVAREAATTGRRAGRGNRPHPPRQAPPGTPARAATRSTSVSASESRPSDPDAALLAALARHARSTRPPREPTEGGR